jgi:hypothetical protein
MLHAAISPRLERAMATIEVSAIYKADQDGFHLDDKASAIFETHGGKWVDQNTCFGGPMHLDRTITYQMAVEQVGAVKLALEQAGFRVTIQQGWSVDDLLTMLDPPAEEDTEDNFAFVTDLLARILNEAAGFYDDRENCIHDFACGVAAHVLSGKPPEHIIEAMAGVAYFMLQEEQAKDWSADTRARLERIRDAR